jgi:hypothetical protein
MHRFAALVINIAEHSIINFWFWAYWSNLHFLGGLEHFLVPGVPELFIVVGAHRFACLCTGSNIMFSRQYEWRVFRFTDFIRSITHSRKKKADTL